MEAQPFAIQVDDDVLSDLHQRLASTGWPDEVADAGWDYGTDLHYLKELAAYWRDDFDWRDQETMLDRFAQFRAETSTDSASTSSTSVVWARPLPLDHHSWLASSFAQMLKIIPPLTDPARAWRRPCRRLRCDRAVAAGFRFLRPAGLARHDWPGIAELWAKLMTVELGYRQFARQAGILAAASPGGWL